MKNQPKERKITWSYGGGTQSIAMMILVAQGKLPKPDCVVMANTGREKSSTWEYHEKYIKPIIEKIELNFQIVENDDLSLFWRGKETLLIPAFTHKGQGMTFCSDKWKKYPVRRYLRSVGYGPRQPIVTWLGMSTDEFKRMKPSGVKWQEYHWPLIYDVRMNRDDCRKIVTDYGLPEPPKSSCWMCPFTDDAAWLKLREEYPDDFSKAIDVEKEIFEKNKSYLFWAGIKLTDVLDVPKESWFEKVRELRKKQQTKIDKDDFCDSGMCFV